MNKFVQAYSGINQADGPSVTVSRREEKERSHNSEMFPGQCLRVEPRRKKQNNKLIQTDSSCFKVP